MQLPPRHHSEPKWLEVQRADKAAQRQFMLAFAPMQAALAVIFLPLSLIDPRPISSGYLLLGLAIYGTAIAGLGFKFARPRTTARTISRYIVNYVAIFWGVVATIALFGIPFSLMV